MLPSQRIELAIYRCIKPLGPRSVTMTLGTLSEATGEDHATIVERLKALEADGWISLTKYSGGHPEAREEFSGDTAFFYNGQFLIEVLPRARGYFERLEQEAEKEAKERSIFISCGQYAPEEIKLGKDMAAAVRENTDCVGYFAENQNSLLGLSTHIFRALGQCAGLVAVMHYRGEVETLAGRKHKRGSVWIEQEIAIAAFLAQTRDKEIPVLLYCQKGIKREGVREQLKLTVVEFEQEKEVLADFVDRLKNGTFKC